MTTPKGNRPVVGADDWMRSVEKRVGAEERRPRIVKASDLLGPGFGPYAVELADWNSSTARLNGLWVSSDAANAPTDTGVYAGLTVCAQEGHGMQLAASHDGDQAVLYARQVHTHEAQAPSYSVWTRVGPPDPSVPDLPLGAMTGWSTSIGVPAGWRVADGATVSRSTYPRLADALGIAASAATFVLPTGPTGTGYRTIVRVLG